VTRHNPTVLTQCVAQHQMYRGHHAEQAKIQAARIARAMHRRLTGTDNQDLDILVVRPIRAPAGRS